jgi:hypothetical protein
MPGASTADLPAVVEYQRVSADREELVSLREFLLEGVAGGFIGFPVDADALVAAVGAWIVPVLATSSRYAVPLRGPRPPR